MRLILFFLLLFSPLYSKIYDCFLFFNELELLEIRLNELYALVDYFVLVESRETHRNAMPKPLYFEEAKNQERFAKFAHKIIHIKIEEHLETDNAWIRENYQRNQIMRGLKKCDPEDLILISDADEFIPARMIIPLYLHSARFPMIGFFQKFYRYFLNRSTNQLWAGTVAIRYKHLIQSSPQEVRNLVRSEKMPFWPGGWHFSTMGGYERSYQKASSIVEGTDRKAPYEEYRALVEKHTLVPIDRSYPQFIQDNIGYLTRLDMIDVRQ